MRFSIIFDFAVLSISCDFFSRRFLFHISLAVIYAHYLAHLSRCLDYTHQLNLFRRYDILDMFPDGRMTGLRLLTTLKAQFLK
jgi:hypothetical protein